MVKGEIKMTDSVSGVEEQSSFTRLIEIRLAEPAPRVRYEKGKVSKEPSMDMTRVIQAIEDQVTETLQAKYGAKTEVRLTVAQPGDVRLTGNFAENPADTKKAVGEVLAEVFDTLELPEE